MNPFNPPIRTLMGPGPSDVHPRVLAAMARPTIGHLDPAFVAMMEETKELLRYAFRTRNEMTLPVSAPGSAGMETCFVNLVEPDDVVVVCRNGVFGDRMRENVERCGATPVMVDDEWGHPVDPPATLCALARARGALSIVDVVTSVGGIPVEVDAWGADAVYAGSQKCLSCPPGLSPVTFGPRAVEAVRNRASTIQSWFLDLNLVMGYWGSAATRSYHHTAPVNALYGLHEGLRMLEEEGLEEAWSRHRNHHRALCAGLEAMGLRLPVEKDHRLPQLNLVSVPDGVDEAQVRKQALERYGLEIGAGLGVFAGKMWRIGLMGRSCSERNVLLCLTALEGILSDMGAPIRRGVALPAAREELDP
ncbi:MAG: pyridoxal-phosphate-dependent aminotransferase family protein [Planctomycetota bacterium]